MEILGLLDTLESMILDGFKIPLSKKTMVNEEKVLAVIDKIRLVVQGGDDFAKRAINRGGGQEEEKFAPRGIEGEGAKETSRARKSVTKLLEREQKHEDVEGKAMEVLQQAYQIAKEVRQGADKYADDILSNIEATSSRILRTVRAGRDKLKKFKGEGEGSSPKAEGEPKQREEKK